MVNFIFGEETKLKNKILNILIVLLLILVSIPGFTSGIEETTKYNIFNNPSSLPTVMGAHTVLVEKASVTWCGNCPPAVGYLDTIYSSESYDFYYVTLVNDMNPYVESRITELEVWGWPTVVFDGGYTRVTGYKENTTPYIDAITTSSSRIVADVDLDISVYWLGDAVIE